MRSLASLRIPLLRVIARSPGCSHAIIFMLGAEEEAAVALLTVERVCGDAVVAGAALVGTALIGAALVDFALAAAGVDVAVIVELLMGTVGAWGCPSMVWVTGAIII